MLHRPGLEMRAARASTISTHPRPKTLRLRPRRVWRRCSRLRRQGQMMSAMAIPEGGVNIDGELGILTAPEVSEASDADGASPVGVQPHVVVQGGAMAIAEGNTSQPVVDGIGFDEPTQIVTGPSGPQPVAGETQVAQEMPEEGEILPLSVDSGNSGMSDPVPVSNARVAAKTPMPAGKDCSLYLDKRNCR
jgi:hypothetical protein